MQHYCPYCKEKPYYAYKKQNLETHIQAKHADEPSVVVQWHFCPENCGYKAKQKAHIKRHLASKHDIGVIWHYCEQCKTEGKEWKTKQKGNLDTHIQSQHSYDPYIIVCQECGKGFKKKQDLTLHLKTQHNIGLKDSDWLKCTQCDYSTIYKGNFEEHRLSRHPTDDDPIYKCDICDKYETRLVSQLHLHKKRIHNEGTSLPLYKCGIFQEDGSVCPYTSHDSSNLKRHKQAIHNVDVQLYTCDVCGHEFKQKANLEKHMYERHSSDNRPYECNIDGCKGKERYYKRKEHLESHIRAAHDDMIEVVCYKCPYDGCDLEAKEETNLLRHIDEIHKNIRKRKCEESGCDYSSKRANALKLHKANIHNINVMWYYCDKCDFKSKESGNVTKHKAYMHGINLKLHTCEFCDYEAKQLSNLKTHLGKVHDIGDKKCQYCLGNRYTLEKMYDAILKKQVLICRACHRKATGYKTRIEKQLVKYLKKEFQYPMTKTDQKVNGDVCLNYRPDIMYSTPGLVVYIEIDEHQHKYGNGGYQCDEKRMSELFDETSGQQVIWIRYNPHAYKPPSGYNVIQKETQRRKLLVKILQEIFKNHEKILKEQGPLCVYYLCYSPNNSIISRNIPHKMIYDFGEFLVQN